MIRAGVLLAAALSLAPIVQRITRDTNSHAATARGVKQFAQKNYADAQKSFAIANDVAPSPARAFNLGTAQIAAGNREAGSSTLAKAMADRRFRADALFNRGNSALSASAYDYAIRDYVDALKIRPGDMATKRNLEIALRRKASMQQQSGGGSSQGSQQKPQPQPANPDNRQQQPKSDPNVESVLRSVQQQEQEELARLHRPSQEKLHVGW